MVVVITSSPFLFPFTVQITEGRSNWVTSEIVYCYRLVCAHATLTRTQRSRSSSGVRFSNAYAHNGRSIELGFILYWSRKSLYQFTFEIFNTITTGSISNVFRFRSKIQYRHFLKANRFIKLKRYRIYIF